MHYTTPKLTQLIHIAKHQLGIDEPTYRQMLETLTGKTTCKAMTLNELMIAYHHLQQKGFKPKPRPKTPTRHPIGVKILALWHQMYQDGVIENGSRTALNHFIHRLLNRGDKKSLVLNVQALDYNNGAKVLEALKQWHAREKRK